jgi:small subunit ribosomal protein S5
METEESPYVEKVIQIDRVNKVVKGGKRLAFRALVIVGDGKGRVAIALGKAKEVPSAIKKGIDRAKKHLQGVYIVGGTLPHAATGASGSSRVLLKPAPPGTGVIAGGAVRILLEAAGYQNVVAKAIRSSSAINSSRAAMNALLQLRSKEQAEKERGKPLPIRFYTSVETPGIVPVVAGSALEEIVVADEVASEAGAAVVGRTTAEKSKKKPAKTTKRKP